MGFFIDLENLLVPTALLSNWSLGVLRIGFFIVAIIHHASIQNTYSMEKRKTIHPIVEAKIATQGVSAMGAPS